MPLLRELDGVGRRSARWLVGTQLRQQRSDNADDKSHDEEWQRCEARKGQRADLSSDLTTHDLNLLCRRERWKSRRRVPPSSQSTADTPELRQPKA
jgi:hypothetical protein